MFLLSVCLCLIFSIQVRMMEPSTFEGSMHSTSTKMINNNIYEDSTLKFSIEKPTSWYMVQPDELKMIYNNLSMPVIFRRDKKIEQEVTPSFAFSQHRFDPLAEMINGNIVGFVTNLGHDGTVETACYYFLIAESYLLPQSESKSSTPFCFPFMLNNEQFARVDRNATVADGVPYYISYLAKIHDEHLFVFMLSQYNDQNWPEFESIMKTLRFSH